MASRDSNGSAAKGLCGNNRNFTSNVSGHAVPLGKNSLMEPMGEPGGAWSFSQITACSFSNGENRPNRSSLAGGPGAGEAKRVSPQMMGGPGPSLLGTWECVDSVTPL